MKGPVKKEDTKKESVAKKEQKDKKLKAKNILLSSWLNRNDQITTTEEAKVACKARKRKERQESISSLCQERKVIRSNSEERPHSRRHSEKDSIIRRVSSSEDLHIQNIKNKRNQSSKENLDVIESNITLVVDECEHETRRSHERFAKPLTLKCKKSFSKRPKGKSFQKTRYKVDDKHFQHEPCKVNIQVNEQIEVCGTKSRKDRSPSPHRAPLSTSFDLTTLHQQVDDSEPLPSCSNIINNDTPSLSVVPNRLLSSPRNSIIATHCIYLDPNICIYNNGRKVINPVEEKLQKISKQLSVLKKKIKKFESDFQLKHGFKPNHLDKINDGGMKKYYIEMTKLKKEYKHLQESGIKFMYDTESNDAKEKSLPEIIAEIEIKLENKREFSSRSCKIEDMTQEQLSEEKIAVQKALLHLENIYGRPIDKEDRNLVRPLYDRYRTLKRLISKASMGNSNSNDLETIHEDETAQFVVESSKSSETVTSEKTSTTVTDSDTDVSINENLHSMDQEELKQQMKLATEEKKVLKRNIKEYEISVQQKTGKMVQKEDKQQIHQLYKNYKTVKSKIRLLDALISKQN